MIETILNSFDIWTDARAEKHRGRVRSIANISLEGIVHLRELILELAVRGKLVPQNPSDEPASKLLQKISAEKKKLVEEGKVKKEKPLPAITEKEKPFEIPNSWEWVRLGNICSKIGSGSTPRGGKEVYKLSGIKFLRSQNVHDDGLSLDNVVYIDEATQSKMQQTKVIANDILLNITGGSIGRCALIPKDFDEANVSQHVTIIRLFSVIENKYLHRFILSPYFQDKIMEVQTGGNREGLAKKNMQLMLSNIPPLEEQKRIVAKVDELMAICDRLEDVQTRNLQTHDDLVEVFLDSLTAAKDPEAVQVAWQQMLPHFDTLFTTEDSIEQLKQTLLQLAVMGRLIKQNPKDEPANKLLQKISAEKKKLIEVGKIRKEKPLPAITEKEKPFALPNGWEWAFIPQALTNDKYSIKRGPFGSSIRKDFFVPVGYKVYEQQNAIYDDFSLGDYYLDDRKFKELKAFEVKPNDIIISCSGTVGKVAIAPNWMEPGIINQALLKLTLNESILTNQYFKILFTAYYLNTHTLINLKGTAQKNMVSVDTLKVEPFPLPPLEEQKRIVAKVDELFAICEALKERITAAEELKNHLSATVIKQAMV